MADQIYKVRDPQGNIREIRGPAGASDEEVIAQAQRLFATPAEPPAPEPRSEGMPTAPRQDIPYGQLTAPFMGFSSGVGNVMFGGQELLGRGLQAIGAQETGAALAEDAARRRAQEKAKIEPYKEQFPIAAGAGELAGEIISTLPVGGAIAAPVRAAGAGRLAQAIRTGGLSTGAAPATTLSNRLADLGIRVGGGAITGGATAGLINPDEIPVGMLTGGTVAATLPSIIKGVGKFAGKAADVGNLPNQLAARMVKESLGSPEQIAAVRAALQQAEQQGLDLTAQQAIARNGLIVPGLQATIEKAVKKTGLVDTRLAKETAQEAARLTTIKNITPDLQASINIRAASAKPFYEAADKAVLPIDSELASVISRMPEGTLAAAANIAKMEGRPFIMGKTTPPKIVETGVLDVAGNPVTKEVPGKTAEITGESLHYIKRALSDIAYGPTSTTGAGRDTQLAARKLLGDYVKVFETKVPEYGEARRIYSDLSAPVNQAQVLKEMASVLEKPGGGERIGPFLNVLGRGEQAMLKRAGGRGGPRFEALDEVLTPQQISSVREVARQLETQTAIKKQITEAQQRASDLIKDELPNYRIPNIFNVWATTANKVLDTLGLQIGDKTIKKIAEASLSAKSFDEILNTLPGEERSKVLKAISNPNTWGKTGATIMKGTTAAMTPPVSLDVSGTSEDMSPAERRLADQVRMEQRNMLNPNPSNQNNLLR